MQIYFHSHLCSYKGANISGGHCIHVCIYIYIIDRVLYKHKLHSVLVQD